VVAFCLAKYRNKIEIIADILNVAREGAKKTHIIYRGNLSFKLANIYLNVVVRAGLIRFDSNNGHYLLTEKGKRFLGKFHKYNRYAKNLEKQSTLVNKEKVSLEEMCFAKNLLNNNDDLVKGDEADKGNKLKQAGNKCSSKKVG
jgi:predicted transcriptional regulator